MAKVTAEEVVTEVAVEEVVSICLSHLYIQILVFVYHTYIYKY